MIHTEGLSKRFGSVLAVDDVDLDVREGDRYGFLGPNGSGKTTTVRMLLGLVFATSGRIELMGQPVPKRARQALVDVGALIEAPAAYGHLSGHRNLMLIDAAGPSGSSGSAGSRRTRSARVGSALEQVGLDAIGRRPVKAYSLGMRQRLGLAAALLRRPRLLVLDEPTNGLDPQGIREVRDLLVTLNEAGTTVFLSSHLLAEVSALCTRVGVLDRGRLVLQEHLSALQKATGRVIVTTPDTDVAAGVLDGQLEHRDGDRLVVRGLSPDDLTARLVRAGARILEVVSERRTLEDVVLSVTSEGSDRMAGRPARRSRGSAGGPASGPASGSASGPAGGSAGGSASGSSGRTGPS